MTHRLRVNPVRCAGHGLCAELFPERVRLDDWGYPLIDRTGFGADLLGLARRAVDQCPRAAIFLEEEDQEADG